MAREDGIEIPQHYFRARCQAPECRHLLGGFHIPCNGGIVVFACPKCHKTSVFRNEAYGIRAVLAGPLVEPAPTAPPTPRR